MTVSETIEMLQQFAPEDIVVLSKDSEGNGYSPLSCISEGIYVGAESGKTYMRELDPASIEDGYTEEDLYQGDDGQAAVILYPASHLVVCREKSL